MNETSRGPETTLVCPEREGSCQRERTHRVELVPFEEFDFTGSPASSGRQTSDLGVPQGPPPVFLPTAMASVALVPIQIFCVVRKAEGNDGWLQGASGEEPSDEVPSSSLRPKQDGPGRVHRLTEATAQPAVSSPNRWSSAMRKAELGRKDAGVSVTERPERSASRRPWVARFAPEHAEAMRTESGRDTGIVSEHIGRPSGKVICAVVGSADSIGPRGPGQRAGKASNEGSGGKVAERSSRRLVLYDYGCSIYI